MPLRSPKTPSFADKIGEPCLSGVLMNIVFAYLLFEMPLGSPKTPSFAHKIGESKLSGADRKNIIEYLLFKKPLGRHQNTQLCT